MTPVEIGEPLLRRQNYDEDENQESLSTRLDLLIKLREKAQIRDMIAKKKATRNYNFKLQPRNYVRGDLVWRMVSNSRKKRVKYLPIQKGYLE